MTSLGPLEGSTPNLGFNLVNFDWIAWHDYEHENWTDVDALLSSITIALGITGVWKNNIAVVAGERYSDDADGSLWECATSHTTPASPTTFAEDRTADPTRWILVESISTIYRGLYTNNLEYKLGEYVSEYAYYAIANKTHTSPAIGDLDDDLSNWNVLVDLRDEVAVGGASARMRWMGEWNGQEYLINDTAVQEGWLGVALQTTSEQIAPVRVGAPFDAYTGTIVSNNAAAKHIWTGMRYTFPRGGFFESYRVRTVVGNEYEVYTVKDPLGANVISFQKSFTGTIDDWVEFGVGSIVVEDGQAFDLLVLIDDPTTGTTDLTDIWNYSNPQNATVPATGQITHANTQLGVIKVHKVSTVANHGSFLNNMTIGDTFEVGSQIWSIQSIVDQTDYIDFGVAPAQQYGTTGDQSFTFKQVTANPITWHEELGYWTGNPDAKGLYGLDVGIPDLTESDAQFGVDIKLQEADFSTHWDIAAVTGGTGSGGGGLTPHILNVHDDVNTTGVQNGDRLAYDSVTGDWIPKTSTSAAGIASYNYLMGAPGDTTPASGRLSTGNDPTAVTTVYVNTLNENGDDLNPFLSTIKTGDWINVFQRSNSANFEAYDVVGSGVLTAGVWAIPVVYFDHAGANLGNGTIVDLFWKSNSSQIVRDAYAFHVDTNDGSATVRILANDITELLLSNTIYGSPIFNTGTLEIAITGRWKMSGSLRYESVAPGTGNAEMHIFFNSTGAPSRSLFYSPMKSGAVTFAPFEFIFNADAGDFVMIMLSPIADDIDVRYDNGNTYLQMEYLGEKVA